MKPLALYFIVLLGTIAIYAYACSTPDKEFNYDYQIDLKQNGYIIKDEAGDQHWVEFGELEEYFLDDNL